MSHLGINIYYWGTSEQRHLLLEGVRPWAVEAREKGLAESFWHCRFDARGPHIFALFKTSATARDRLQELLSQRLSTFLERSPSRAILAADELERRHAECRGKALCRVDGADGIAANNTFVLFDHEADGYPLWLDRGMAQAGAFWRQLDALSFWTLARLEQGEASAASVRWLAAVGGGLSRRGLPAAEYWRLHATTLIPSLAGRWETEPDALLASLAGAVSERNRLNFARIWDRAGAAAGEGFDIDPLIEAVTADDGRTLEQRFRVLREVNHTTLAQLEQPVALHIPMVLYAWQQSLCG